MQEITVQYANLIGQTNPLNLTEYGAELGFCMCKLGLLLSGGIWAFQGAKSYFPAGNRWRIDGRALGI